MESYFYKFSPYFFIFYFVKVIFYSISPFNQFFMSILVFIFIYLFSIFFSKLIFLFNFTFQSNIKFILYFNFDLHSFNYYFFNPFVYFFFNFIIQYLIDWELDFIIFSDRVLWVYWHESWVWEINMGCQFFFKKRDL